MRETWYRDPRWGLAAAVIAALAVGWTAAMAAEPQPGWRIALLALAGFALVAWGWFALQGIAWIWRRPDRRDVLQALALQQSQENFNQAAWTRFDRDAAMLRMLLAERALMPIEAEMVRHAMAVEQFDAVAEALPGFSRSAAYWYDIASQGHASLPPATPAPSAAALEDAAADLPAVPLSDEDRRAALHYLAVRKRLTTDRAMVERERRAALRKLATPPPAIPGEPG